MRGSSAGTPDSRKAMLTMAVSHTGEKHGSMRNESAV